MKSRRPRPPGVGRRPQRPRRPRRPGRLAGSAGSASVEMTLLTIPILVLVAFTVFVGRYASTYQEVGSAARDAARAASLRQEPEAAVVDGVAAAEATLANRGISCTERVIDVDANQLFPGGEVVAVVECTVSTADLSGLGVPGDVKVRAEAIVVVDAYRGGERP